MAGRLARSWRILRFSAGVLRRNKRLLVLPVFSFGAAALLLAGYLGLYWRWQFAVEPGTSLSASGIPLAVGFVFYFAASNVVIFFNSALVLAAAQAMNGEQPTVGGALRGTLVKSKSILGYASLSATLGVLLNILEDRLGVVGVFVARLFGIAWALATYLAIPVLVYRDIGPIDAVRESAALLKRTWGENIVANAGLGLLFGFLYFALIFLAMIPGSMVYVSFMDSATGPEELFLTGVAFLAVCLVLLLLIAMHTALNGIYATALYRHAIGAPTELDTRQPDDDLFGSAFHAKS